MVKTKKRNQKYLFLDLLFKSISQMVLRLIHQFSLGFFPLMFLVATSTMQNTVSVCASAGPLSYLSAVG